MFKKKIYSIVFLSQSILFIFWFSFWAKLYLSPSTWSFRMLCPISVEVKLDHQWWESYGTRIDTIFNPLDILGSNISFSRSWYYNTIVQSDITDTPTRFITSAYNNPITQRISWDNLSLWTLDFETNSVNTTETRFEIYTHTIESSDFSADSSVMQNPTTDILNETWAWYYTFSPWTCEPDMEFPQDVQYVLDLNNTDKIKYFFGFDFFVRDGSWYTKDQPWYKDDNIVLQDAYYGKNQADKASWIDPSSMEVSFVYSDWSRVVFTGNSPWVNFAGTWKTRNRRRRDYRISFSPFGLVDFGIEKTMRFSGYISDYDWHTKYFYYTFNNPVAPRIWYQNPSTWAENVLPKTDIVIRISDNRAWVDPDSLQVSIYSWWCSGELIWDFSGSNLYKQAISGFANTPDYFIKILSGSIYSWEEFILPTNKTEICLIVKAEDNEQNELIWPLNTYSFTTRDQCWFYDCSNMFQIYRNPNAITWQIYRLQNLYITWWTNPYISNNTLYCGILGQLTNITWNISNSTNFKEDKLYISWGYFSLSWETLIITPFIVNN